MKLYTIKDIAEARGTRRETVRTLILRHQKGQKVGKTIVFDEDEYKYLIGIKNWNNHKTWKDMLDK